MDALNVMLAIDEKLGDLWEPLDPHYNVFEANTPRAISSNVALPKPVVSTIANWFQSA